MPPFILFKTSLFVYLIPLVIIFEIVDGLTLKELSNALSPKPALNLLTPLIFKMCFGTNPLYNIYLNHVIIDLNCELSLMSM